jgi:hypothetical protein
VQRACARSEPRPDVAWMIGVTVIARDRGSGRIRHAQVPRRLAPAGRRQPRSPADGRLARRCAESLSEHRGHGSAPCSAAPTAWAHVDERSGLRYLSLRPRDRPHGVRRGSRHGRRRAGAASGPLEFEPALTSPRICAQRADLGTTDDLVAGLRRDPRSRRRLARFNPSRYGIISGMNRRRLSTTVHAATLARARRLLPGPDSALVDRALAALIEQLEAERELAALSMHPYEDDADLAWQASFGPDLPYEGEVPDDLKDLARRRQGQ